MEIVSAIKFTCIWPIILLNFNFANIEIKNPLFILGFPRSGTTFLHKTLTNDNQFTTPLLWELLFAPSILQKKIFWRINNLFNMKYYGENIRWFKKITKKFDHIHQIKLSNPEEDYLSLIPFGGCFLLIIII